MMHLSVVNGAIEAIRPGQRPKMLRGAISPSYVAYLEARFEAHLEAIAGELTTERARQLGQECRLIVVKERE